MTIKLMILKIVPSTRPFPNGFIPDNMRINATTIAVPIALEQYFFCDSLTDSIIWTVSIVCIFFGCLKNLTINGIAPADYAEDCKDCYKNAPCSQPPVQVSTHKKTKYNAPGHGKADLHDNR